MSSQQVMFYGIVAVAMVLVVVYIVYYLQVHVLNPQGKDADKKTRKVLSRYALLRQYKVLPNVRLTGKDGEEFLIHSILVGYFGILIVHTLGARGEYYGQSGEENWVLVQDGKRQTFPNPLLVQERQKAAIRYKFSKSDVYNIPIENVVHITSSAAKTTIYISDEKVIHAGRLKGFLGKSQFEKDNGVDVDKIASLLEA